MCAFRSVFSVFVSLYVPAGTYTTHACSCLTRSLSARCSASVSSTVKSPAAIGIDEKAWWHHPYALHLIAGLRLFQPPREVAVVINDSREPDSLVFGRKSSQKVRRHFGPWELSGGWWSTDYERLYYEVETSRERMYLVYYDRLQSRWFMQGVFD